ncbi:MAG: Protein arginine N-methyltransferase 5, partial [Pleopsidium flavum]
MDSLDAVDEYMPIFFVGQHESSRSLPVSAHVLRQAQDCNYDMLTTPITTPYFHNRVLALLSPHLSQLESCSHESHSSLSSSSSSPVPLMIPPLGPLDTPLTPNDTISQLLAVASPWIDLCSPDPIVSHLSQQVLSLEIAYAAFCGVGNVIIQGPKLHHGKAHADGLVQYARAIHEALSVGSNMQIEILLPMIDQPESEVDDGRGSLAPFARHQYVGDPGEDRPRKVDMYGSWDAWNVIRAVSLSLPRQLPPLPIQSRWYSEPLRLLSMTPSTFVKNAKGYPVLSQPHRTLITRYMRLRAPPWILLCDVGPIPGLDNPNMIVPMANGFLSPNAVVDAGPGSSPSPTPSEAAQQLQNHYKKFRDPTPHLSYIRNLQGKQPPRTKIERFGAGFQDYLQSPLQPLTDNLESNVYEVFEKDPVKYDWYERAIARALSDWIEHGKPTSSADGRVVVAVVGAGRGPLVTRVLQASEFVNVGVEVWAVEKNPNAYILLQHHNEEDWHGRVNVIKSDMRAWKGPWREHQHPTAEVPINQAPIFSAEPSSSISTGDTHSSSVIDLPGDSTPQRTSTPASASGYGHVDILISELLGSFADNELSPECLDGVQHVLDPNHGISIPSSYTAHLTPIAAPKLHADIVSRTPSDPAAPETPWVVMLHAIDYLSTSIPSPCPPTNTAPGAPTPSPTPNVLTAWEFTHPLPAPTLELSTLRRSASSHTPSGLTGGDGSNAHNARYSRLSFRCRERGVCHGLAGYFETVLYGDVEL